MNQRILITGAAGYIGHQLGNRLAADFHVVGTDIRPRNDLAFPVRQIDIRDSALAELLKEEGITTWCTWPRCCRLQRTVRGITILT